MADNTTGPSAHMAAEYPEYEQRVRDAFWEIVAAKYEVYERSGARPREQRFEGIRPFWTSFTFESVSVEGSHPSTELVVRFCDSRDPRRKFGFRHGIWDAVSWWERFGPKGAADTIRDAPERLGYELVFSMVFAISVAPSHLFADRDDRDDRDVTWLSGDEWEEAGAELARAHPVSDR